jgi:predicted SpoU family rRNA methylase
MSAILTAGFTTRIVYPIHVGLKMLTLDGKPIRKKRLLTHVYNTAYSLWIARKVLLSRQ